MKKDTQPKTLVKGANLIDGTGRTPIQRGAVLIEGDRVVAVGTEESIGPVDGSLVIDFGEQTLLPGLIDCHNHLSMDPTLQNYGQRMMDSDAELALRAAVNMSVDLRSGVTTARCLGDRSFLDVTCRRMVAEGRIAGPRLLIATRGIRAPRGHGYVGYPFEGVEAVGQAVKENLAAGADIIKLYATGTVKDGDIPCFLTRDEMSVAVREAHAAGIPTAIHCIGGPGISQSVAAGVDAIEHGYFATDADIDLLIGTGRWLVLTPGVFFMEERIGNLAPHLTDGFRQGRAEVAERYSTFLKSGVRFAVGTDGMHGALAREVELLVQLGAHEDEAIAAATRYAAELCGLIDIVGTVEPGKMADILVTEGNPLEDIRALARVHAVIQGGRLVYCRPLEGHAGHPSLLG